MILKKIFLFLIVFSLNNLLFSQTKKDVLKRTKEGITVIVNKKTGKYTLQDKDGKVLFKNLRGLVNLDKGYQAINSKNELINIYVKNGITELKPNVSDLKYSHLVCGSVSNYETFIKDTLDHFIVILKEDNRMMNRPDTTTIVAEISKNDVDDCFFINDQKEFSYNDNYPKMNAILNLPYEDPGSIIFKKNTLYGIFGKTKAIYSEIKISNLLTKVKKDNLYSYYEINKSAKYKELGPFVGAFARFKLPNGKKGYITGSGYEYRDEQ